MPSFCPYFNQGQCRSCDLIELEYSAQMGEKEKVVLSMLGADLKLEPSVLSSPQGFRNRAKMSVTGTIEKPVIGLVGDTNLDNGRELLRCPIHHPKLNELIAKLPEYITRFNLYPYSIKQRRGELKGLIAFYSPHSRQMYLRFILRSKDCVSRLIKMLPAFQTEFPELVCVTANLQPIPHAILEGKEEIYLTEKHFIDHELSTHGRLIRLRLAPQAFVQTNVEIATELYQTAARWISEAGSKRTLDLYCGQGAFSFFAAPFSESVLAVEINADAVRSATESASEQGITHLQFKCADATQIQDDVEKFNPDLVLVNPPRRGLGDAVRMLHKCAPRHIFYSSCSIETLSADLKKLSPHYEIKRLQIFDMFPHTRHFETLVWLGKT
jgi:23S rRNA (uracil747-C5)-methyltransferase